MSKLLHIVFLLFALGMVAALAVGDPLAINQQVNDLFGWKPTEPVDARLVSEKDALELRALSEGITSAVVQSEIERFAAFGSRVPGYPGERQAYEYIRQRFGELGLQDVKSDEFEVTVPLDKGAELRLPNGQRQRVYALWPNGVRTSSLPAGGVHGPLVYGGRGDLEALDGQPLDGAIALLDFDGGQNYLNLATLGARAIIFFDNGGVNREQAADKFLKVPVDVPRFWIEREEALALLAKMEEGPFEVNLEGQMDWEAVKARNIYGWLPGSAEMLPAKSREGDQAWKDQVIVIQAYYDAISVVPALAPGAENAAGIVALLQLAETLAKHRPQYSVLFLATSGHFEGLEGINDFLYRHSRQSEYFRERMSVEDRIDFDLMLSLDLSSHGDRSVSFGMGTFYNPTWQTDNYIKYMLKPYSKRLSLAVEEVFADSTRHYEGITPPKRTWKNYMPIPLAFASEAAAFVGQKALALSTANDARERVDTPLDLPQAMNMENLTRQIRTIAAMLAWAGRDAELLKPGKLELEDYGHSLAGSIYWFDRDVNFAVPKAPVAKSLVTYQQQGPNSVGGVRSLMVRQADEEGRFRFDIMRNRYDNTIKAYELDARGQIVSAPDMGQDGNETYPMLHPWGWWENEMLQVLFKCRALSLFETVDSRYLSVLDHVTVLDDRDGMPQSWGADFVERQSNEEGKVTLASVVYAPPDTRVKVLMSTSLFGVRYLLSGAPAELLENPLEPEAIDDGALKSALGRGYPVNEGVVLRPGYAAARDMWVLDDVRIKQLARYGVRNGKFMRLHEEARAALVEAGEHLKARNYSKFKAKTREAWGLEGRGYPDIKATADDTVYGVIFYFALLLPFSFCCERLVFGFADVRRQMLGASLFFLSIFMIMRFIHPAFKISSSPYIIFLAFVIFAIGGSALMMILGRFTREVGQRKRASVGIHEADIGRLSATSAAVALGVSNLRKRKARTLLTVLTLTLLTFTTQAFTSVQSYLKFFQIPRPNAPVYDGALLRDRGWKGLQLSVLDYAESAFSEEAKVLPRAWLASHLVGERAYIDIRQKESSTESFAFALLGLSPGEKGLMGMGNMLIGERSRWFEEGERDACILPQAMGEILGIGPEDVGQKQVWIMGHAYRVIGLIDGDAVDQLRDLDNESPIPVDTVAEAKKMQEMANLDPRLMDTAAIETFTHLLANNVAIMPYQKVIDLGGTLRSVAITDFSDSDILLKKVEDFVVRVAMPLFVGEGDQVRVYTSMGSASLSGMGNLFVPLLIAALIVLNTMLGAVYERSAEIGVYSSVGLAPGHISSLFIAEAMVFAIVGAVLGYLVGQTATLVLTRYDMLGGMFLNYSSLSAITSTLMVMATVVLSTIYPARRAASMSVPDVTRRWQFPEPDGDHWRFDFPFTLAKADALGSCAYLHRVFSSYGEGSVGDFMTEEVEFELERGGEVPIYLLRLKVWLAPYDLGVSQRVSLRTMPTDDMPGIYRIEMQIERVSGDVASWKRLNTSFLHVLRKRFLVWRTIPQEVRQTYREQGEELLGVKEAPLS
jgi:hypothetical protein